MSKTTAIADAPTLRLLRAKEALYDELVEQLAQTERRLEQAESKLTARDGVSDEAARVWRAIASELAGALRPYSLFGEVTVEDGRCVIHTRVATATLRDAQQALERLAEEVARESYRSAGMTPSDLDAAA